MSHSSAPSGLYVFKPWYAERLSGVRSWLRQRRVHPDTVSAAGVGFAAVASAALVLLPPGPAALVVGPALALRLAAANLDGELARETGRTSRRGAVVNELSDRAAELVVLAGCFALAPAWIVLATMLAASAPSWVALAGAAAGAPRINGGPVGKTERCLLLTVLAAVPGSATVLLVVIAVGSLLTAGVRAWKLRG